MIRKAARHDIQNIIDMMRDYANEAPICALKNADKQDRTYVGNLIFTLIAGRGVVLVDDDCRGFIAGVVVPNIWCPDVMELRELAWWVEPEYRGTSLGGRLWSEFNKTAQDMLDAGRVKIVCVSAMQTSPSLNYEKRGYALLETTYFREKE